MALLDDSTLTMTLFNDRDESILTMTLFNDRDESILTFALFNDRDESADSTLFETTSDDFSLEDFPEALFKSLRKLFKSPWKLADKRSLGWLADVRVLSQCWSTSRSLTLLLVTVFSTLTSRDVSECTLPRSPLTRSKYTKLLNNSFTLTRLKYTQLLDNPWTLNTTKVYKTTGQLSDLKQAQSTHKN